MDGGRFHNIRCIFDAIDLMATKNPDFERSQEVIEKRDLVLHLNAELQLIEKFLKVNGIKDGG